MSIDIGKDILDAFGLSDDDEPEPKIIQSEAPTKSSEPELELAPAQKPFIPPPQRKREQKYEYKEAELSKSLPKSKCSDHRRSPKPYVILANNYLGS